MGGAFLATVDNRDYRIDGAAVISFLAGPPQQDREAPLDASGRLRFWRDRRLRSAQSFVRRNGHPVSPDKLVSGAAIYLNVGHQNLTRERVELLRSAGWRSVAMIHDTHPVDLPQFAGPGSRDRFQAFLNAATQADIVLSNSQDTARHLTPYLAKEKIVTAPLGVGPPRPATFKPARVDGRRGAFLCIGTIEPRKNHAMLLDIWCSLGTEAPHLRIVGRRGWRNEAVFRRLETDETIGKTVFEVGAIDDAQLAEEICSARAVLMPSLAEGYGLPVAEALSLGTPVIASDLPALHEVGGAVPHWLPPNDPRAWKAAILEFGKCPSPVRDAQLDRLRSWTPPTWQAHFAIVAAAIGLEDTNQPSLL